MAKNVLVLKHFESPKEAGVYYRLVTLTGSTKGEAYVLMGNRIVIGRGEKVDVKMTDLKASREHAEITKVGDSWVVTNLSQNGIVVNDQKVTQKTLAEGDKLIIGQTVFKFVKVEVNTSPKKSQKNDEDSEASVAKKSTMPLLILVAVAAGMFLIDDNNEEIKTRKKPVAASNYQDVSNDYVTALQKRQANEDKQAKEKLNMIYQRGLREFREGNYYRAIHEFNLALIIAPSDAQAEYYLRKTKEELDRSIESFTAKAQRDEESLKFQSAIVSYCSIIRLLNTVPDDPRYKNAEKQITELEAKLGMEKGETSCLKKQRTS